jgi:sulfur-oxidizing protein SoxY
MRRRAVLAAILILGAAPAFAQLDPAEQPSEAWSDLQRIIFGDREISDAGAMIALDAPLRAHDAAVVPVEIAIRPPLGRVVERFSLIVDENPAPVAAEFEVGEALGREIDISTRIRVDAYSNVRVVAELDDGTLHQSARFVRAAGGCSAPALKDAEQAAATAGQMRVRVFEAAARGDAQVSVRHPNYSGFQINQITLLPIPAWFVDRIEVTQGERLVFRMEGGISLSADPAIRFAFDGAASEPFTVRAEDTSGAAFEGVFPASTGS